LYGQKAIFLYICFQLIAESCLRTERESRTKQERLLQAYGLFPIDPLPPLLLNRQDNEPKILAMARNSKHTPEASFYRQLGRNLRVARSAAGKSQMEAAEHIDVSFQQLQKYESGANRIPVYGLVSLAAYLEAPLSQLIAPSDGDSEFQSLAAQFSGKEFHALMEAWAVLKDRQTRAALLNLVKSLAAAKR
jgi:transcriptional regulator with XRE-family HTH domain